MQLCCTETRAEQRRTDLVGEHAQPDADRGTTDETGGNLKNAFSQQPVSSLTSGECISQIEQLCSRLQPCRRDTRLTLLLTLPWPAPGHLERKRQGQPLTLSPRPCACARVLVWPLRSAGPTAKLCFPRSPQAAAACPALSCAGGAALPRFPAAGRRSAEFGLILDDTGVSITYYIQQNIRADCSNIDKILEPPEGQDEGVWKYEHLRQFCLELNGLAVKLQSECHPDTCTQMTATEQWIFLCAAHKTPKECPAIDYTRHTLDGAACLLNSNKYFPSRVSIKESSVAKLGSVCRRIYRIFSHAYFHHRQIFDEYENETFLCHRFTKFVMKYNLMSKDNLIVPILEEEMQNSVSGESEA
ncbi:PREDICTED: MOB-like protein phocein [Chaetura pelagica]|uniref:MOB-like protein phocein n=1 Tax=Chaetura pelagica TaxID=8897 RepID=UPI0005234A11|nr:PREDICTED: MOB-like protein phocein [Chaetura pelagica]